MWDPSTMRIVMMHDVIWLKKLYFQPDDMTGVLELDTAEGLDDSSKSSTQVNAFEPVRSGGKIMWSLTEPTRNMVTRPGRVFKPPDRLTHTSAVELRYLGEMAELDQVDLMVVYMSIRHMEFPLVGAGVGGGIKHMKEL